MKLIVQATRDALRTPKSNPHPLLEFVRCRIGSTGLSPRGRT
jgi:hypothetical protein